MLSLLKIDFKRVLKDKLFMVLAILALVFAVISPLLYKVLFSLLEAEEFAGMVVDGKMMFFSSFSAGNNLGLIAPILVMIALCKDFSFGTIRNKIISGKTRAQIFISLFITCFVITWGVILAHALVTLGFSLLFFDYQSTPFTAADFNYFISSLALQMLIWFFICAIMALLIVLMKNAGLAVVTYAAVMFIFTIFGSIVQAALMMPDFIDQATMSALECLNGSNPFVNSIGLGTSYQVKDVLYMLIPCTVGSILCIGLGIVGFNKKDLK